MDIKYRVSKLIENNEDVNKWLEFVDQIKLKCDTDVLIEICTTALNNVPKEPVTKGYKKLLIRLANLVSKQAPDYAESLFETASSIDNDCAVVCAYHAQFECWRQNVDAAKRIIREAKCDGRTPKVLLKIAYQNLRSDKIDLFDGISDPWDESLHDATHTITLTDNPNFIAKEPKSPVKTGLRHISSSSSAILSSGKVKGPVRHLNKSLTTSALKSYKISPNNITEERQSLFQHAKTPDNGSHLFSKTISESITKSIQPRLSPFQRGSLKMFYTSDIFSFDNDLRETEKYFSQNTSAIDNEKSFQDTVIKNVKDEKEQHASFSASNTQQLLRNPLKEIKINEMEKVTSKTSTEQDTVFSNSIFQINKTNPSAKKEPVKRLHDDRNLELKKTLSKNVDNKILNSNKMYSICNVKDQQNTLNLSSHLLNNKDMKLTVPLQDIDKENHFSCRKHEESSSSRKAMSASHRNMKYATPSQELGTKNLAHSGSEKSQQNLIIQQKEHQKNNLYKKLSDSENQSFSKQSNLTNLTIIKETGRFIKELDEKEIITNCDTVKHKTSSEKIIKQTVNDLDLVNVKSEIAKDSLATSRIGYNSNEKLLPRSPTNNDTFIVTNDTVVQQTLQEKTTNVQTKHPINNMETGLNSKVNILSENSVPKTEKNNFLPLQIENQNLIADGLSMLKAPEEVKPVRNIKKYFSVKGKQYGQIKCIGYGGSCKVFEVISEDGKIFALKRVKLVGCEPFVMQTYINEIKWLEKLQGHPCIIELIDWEEKDDHLLIVLEKGDTDLSHILKGSNLTIPDVRRYWRQIVSAVDVIHKAGIVHTDLKPANFLFVGNILKLIDFGIASRIQDNKTSVTREWQMGTVSYMAPETLMLNTDSVDHNGAGKVSKKSDVWSLGCILYAMFFKKTPYQHLRYNNLKVKAIQDGVPIKFDGITDPIVLDCLKGCLAYSKQDRYSIAQLLDHQFMKEN